MTDIQNLRRILKNNRNVAVVGLSANWYRPSYFEAKYLIDHGFNVLPVNPNYVVDIFQKPDQVPQLVEQAIAVGAKVIWMQVGIVHEQAARRARKAGLEVVMDRCMKIEYARLFGGLNFIGVNTRVVSSKRPLYVTY